MPGIVAGGYHCKTHGTLYTYQATWEETSEHTVRWTAQVFYDRRLGEDSGEVNLPRGADPGDVVRNAIHTFIEDGSCATAQRTDSTCGPAFGAPRP